MKAKCKCFTAPLIPLPAVHFGHELNGCRVALAVPNRWCWKTNAPLREGVLKVKSWVLFTHCYKVCVKLLLHCSNEIRPSVLPAPSTSEESGMGQCACESYKEEIKRWTNPHCCLSALGAFLSLGSPFAGGRNADLSHCASGALLGLCRALWMCSVWAKG